MVIDRRTLIVGAGVCASGSLRAAEPAASEAWLAAVKQCEAESGGRLGVAVQGAFGSLDWRGDERFPLCSTFKLLAAGAVLQRVDAGLEQLHRRIVITAHDLVDYSPITSQHVDGEGMPMGAICEAAITRSDNTAGNLMLAAIGGPPGLTRFLRSIDDPVTRLDRIEPALNEAAAGDERDTTSPHAMLRSVAALTGGPALSPPGRTLLLTWLGANKTGDPRLRAGLPAAWHVGDKTGSGEKGTTNDVATVLLPDGSTLLIAAFLTGTSATTQVRDKTLADVARAPPLWSDLVRTAGVEPAQDKPEGF